MLCSLCSNQQIFKYSVTIYFPHKYKEVKYTWVNKLSKGLGDSWLMRFLCEATINQGSDDTHKCFRSWNWTWTGSEFPVWFLCHTVYPLLADRELCSACSPRNSVREFNHTYYHNYNSHWGHESHIGFYSFTNLRIFMLLKSN